jgi:hypothetical protein
MPCYRGSCLCGQVTYQVSGEPLGFYHCHCQRCRKMSGTGHASNLRVEANRVDFLTGAELVKSYRVPTAIRFRNDFCLACGSPLPRFFSETGFVIIPAGTLDSEPEQQPQARIFYESRAAWSCADSLPEFPEYPVYESFGFRCL